MKRGHIVIALLATYVILVAQTGFAGENNSQTSDDIYLDFNTNANKLGVSEDNFAAQPADQTMVVVSYKIRSYPGASAHLGYTYLSSIDRADFNTSLELVKHYSASHNIEAGMKIDF